MILRKSLPANRRLLCALLLGAPLLLSCTERFRANLEIKNLALNPAEFMGQKFALQGRITSPSPGLVAFMLEDNTGTVLVTTERMAERFPCSVGDRAVIVGRVAKNPKTDSVYVSAESLEECIRGQARTHIYK